VNPIFHTRVWTGLTGLVMPLLAMAAYVLGWSPVLQVVLTVLCVTGIYGPWLVATDLRRWRAEQGARLRARMRRLRPSHRSRA